MGFFKRSKRGDDGQSMQALAEELGLTYIDAALDDDYRAAMGPLPPLSLFRQGNEASIFNLSYGRLHDLDTRVFNFDLVSHASDDARAHRSCVLLTFDAHFPEVFISPRDGLPRLGEKLTDAGIAFASHGFQKRFRVQATNRQHALDIIDPDMEHFLLDAAHDRLRIELQEGALLGHVPDLPGADEFGPLIDCMHGFYKRIPQQAWQLYRSL
jgi:hypothetical protein